MEWDHRAFQVEEAAGQGPGVGGAYCVRETREGQGGWRKPLREEAQGAWRSLVAGGGSHELFRALVICSTSL